MDPADLIAFLLELSFHVTGKVSGIPRLNVVSSIFF